MKLGTRDRVRRVLGVLAFLICFDCALAQGGDDVQHIGDTSAGIDLTVGPGSGIVSCGEDQVYLEATQIQSGITRIRVYFWSLKGSVDRSVLGKRISCAIRLRESHASDTKLALLGAYLRGSSDIGGGVTASVGISVFSMGQLIGTANQPIAESGYFSKKLISSVSSSECLDRDQRGLFGINVAASIQSRTGQAGFVSIDRLDLYVKEELCQ